MNTEPLVVPVEADDAQFQSALQSMQGRVSAFGSFIGNLAANVVSGAFNLVSQGVQRATAFIGESVNLASDLSETITKTQVVFGDTANVILKWSEDSASAMGISQNAALTAAGVFGNLFRAMEIGELQSSDMSMSLIELAGDLASFNNMDPTEVLDKLRAGLVGETEPLRSLGVNLNQAMIEQKALELEIWDGVDALTAAEKAQASYALIMEQTSLAQGDFARTSEGLANQQRILAANFENIKTKIGSALLPVWTEFTSRVNSFLDTPKFQSMLDTVIKGFENITKWTLDIALPAVTGFVEGAQSAFEEGGFEGLFSFIDEQMAIGIDNLDWAGWGSTLGEMIDGALGLGFEGGKIRLPEFAVSFGEGIKEFFIAAIGEENLAIFKEHFVDYIILQLNNLDAQMTAIMQNAVNRLLTVIATKLYEIRAAFVNWATVQTPATMLALATSLLSGATTTMNALATFLDNKLRDIGKAFFNRALAWTAQAKAGFENGIDTLLGAISNIVGEVNKILKKIITSFTLSIKIPDWLSGAIPGFGSGGGGSGGSVGGHPAPKASGGPVFPGRAYTMHDGEIFTPFSPGRIDTPASNALQFVTIVNWDEFDYQRLAGEIIKAENSV